MPYQIKKRIRIGRDVLTPKKKVISVTGVDQSHPEKTGTDLENLDRGRLMVVGDGEVDPVIAREIALESGNQLSESLDLLPNSERADVNAQQVRKEFKSFWRKLRGDLVHLQMAIIRNGIVILRHQQIQVYSPRKPIKNFMRN